ncbi:MAG: hypothetical protein IPH59_11850 [bacterium]|nr:hypothetical protein [bacterium]
MGKRHRETDPIQKARGGTTGNKNAAKVKNDCDNITIVPPSGERGTSTDYTLKRLARDNHDDLLDAIEAGELSVNQAAIRAGYRKKLSHAEKCVAEFRKAENRLEPLRVIVAELDTHEVEVLKDWLSTPTMN